MIVMVVPGLTVHATPDNIREDAVAVLREMVKKVASCPRSSAAATMSINRFEDAYAIAEEVNHPLVGVTLGQYHFHAMASVWDALKKAATVTRAHVETYC